MDGLSQDLKTKLHRHGTKAVIEHLEKVLNSNDNTEYPKIKTQVVDFITSQQDELDNCAVEIGRCLQKNGIRLDDVNQIFELNPRRSRRRDAHLKRIEEKWGNKCIEEYQWTEKGVHFLQDLANIAGQTEWHAAVGLFNRVILDSGMCGGWGREDHCPERPIQQTHLTKVLRYLTGLRGEGTKNKARRPPNVQGRSSIVPLGRDELLNNKEYKVDTNGLLIARSGSSQTRSSNLGSSEYASIIDPEETVSQTGNSDCTCADSQTNTNGYFEDVLNTPPVISSASSPSDCYTEGGVDSIDSGDQGSGDTATERAKTKEPSPQTTDSWDRSRDERPLDVLLRERFEQLHERMHESAKQVTKSQQDSLAQITETIQNLDARDRSTAEATRFFVDHTTKLMHALKEQLVRNSCRCEDILAPQVQEYFNSGLYEGLSRQLTQLKEGLEFTRSSITQGISHHVLNLDKELAGQVKAQTQNDLGILYNATKDHLEQLHQASRDCIAQAGMAIAGELKPIASAGSVITERISNTLKKHMEETVQCNRWEFEKSTIQMKHEFSEKTRDIQDQQTVVLTAIESQTKTIVSAMSIVQETVASMNGEIRDLRKDLEALRHISAVSGATCVQNNTQEHGKDFENENRCLEVVKRYQHNGYTACNFKSTEADFTACSTADDTYIQGSSGNNGGNTVSTMCYSPDRDCRLVMVGPSLEIDPDAGALYIVSNTADSERNIPGKELVGQEVTADDDMTDVFNGPTFFAAPNSMITVFTPFDTWRSRRTEYQSGGKSIAFSSSQPIRNRVGNRRPLAAHSRPRPPIQEKRINRIRSKAGHLGGRQTAKSIREAAIIKKKLDETRKARLRSQKRRDMKLSDHVKAQTPVWSSHGGVSSDEEDDLSVEKSGGLIRDLEPDSTSNLGYYDHFNSPASDVSSVQSSHGGHISIGVSSTATIFKTDHESLDSLEASEDFASAAVTQIRESQEDSRNHTSIDASEAPDRSLMSASELMTVKAAEASPTQGTSVALATEYLETRAIASLDSNNISSENLSNNPNHTTFGRNKPTIVVLEGFEANSLDNSDARDMSSAQSEGQIQSSEDTDDIYPRATYKIGGDTAAERKTPNNDDGTTSPFLVDSRTEKKVYGDQDSLEEGLRARVEDHTLREQPGALPGQVTRVGVHKTLGSFEATKMVTRQLVHEVGKPDHDDNGETLESGEHHQHQMTPRSNECGHHSDVADSSVVHSFDAVTSGAQGSRQSDHRTGDWTKDPESDLEIAPVTNLLQSNDSSQGVTGNGYYDSLDVGPKGDQSVTTPPLCPPVCDQDMATVVVDTLSSSTVDGQNGSGISGYVEKDIGVARDLTYVSKDQPQLPTSILPPPDVALPASPSRPIGALLSTESCKTHQQGSQQGTDPNLCTSKSSDEDDSAAPDHLLEDIRPDHAASSLLGEPRGQKRSGIMPDRINKDKRVKFLDDVNLETMTTCPSEDGRNKSAVALLEPPARISGEGISASLQNNEPVTGTTPFATVARGNDHMEGIEPRSTREDVENQGKPMQLTAWPDGRTVDEGKLMASMSTTSLAGQQPMTILARTGIVSNYHASKIEGMTGLGIESDGKLSSGQPAVSPFEEASGKKRSREASDGYLEREKKSARLAGDGDADTVRPYMADSEGDRREKITGSSDIGMADSSAFLNRNLESKSGGKTVIENDPEISPKLGVTTPKPAIGGWKALFEQGRRERDRSRRKTLPVKEAIQHRQRQRKDGNATVSLEDSVFVPPYRTSLEFEHRKTFGFIPLSAAAIGRVVEHEQIGTQVSTSTKLEDRDKQRLPGSSPQETFVVGEEPGVNIHNSSPDRQHVVTSQTQSTATTGRSAAMAGHTNSQLDSIQLTSDEHGGLQSVDPVNKEDVKPTQPLQTSGILSQNPLSGSSAANSVSSLAHKENTQQELEPNSSTVVGDVEGFDDFSQTVPRLESDDIA